MKRIIFCVTILAASSLFTGCLKENGADKGESAGNNDPVFDYALSGVKSLNVDYHLNGYGDNGVIFEVYQENPYTEDGILKEGATPLFSAFTDKSGKFSGQVKLPTAVDKIYIATKYFGAPKVVEVPVSGSYISFDALNPVSPVAVRSARNGYTCEGFIPLGEWDALGSPLYKGDTPATIPNNLMKDIMSILKDEEKLEDNYPGLLEGYNRCIQVVEADAEFVDMVFMHCGGSYNNAIGYYTYSDIGNPPTEASQVKKFLAFPSAQYLNAGGGLVSGDVIRLKYWNEDKGEFQDRFPKGTVIAFFAASNAFKNTGNVVADDIFYSDYNMIPGQLQQMVAFKDANRSLVVLGVEDLDRSGSGTDGDFNDVIFYIKSIPDVLDIPPGPTPTPIPDPEEVKETYIGTLCFEDLWPNRGDYDINDMVIEYTCEVYKDKNNKVIRTKDLFRPINNGAQLQSAFAVQYGVERTAVASATFTDGAIGVASPHNDKNPYVSISWLVDGKGYELNNNYANRLIFDDIRRVKQDNNVYSFIVETVFKDDQRPELATLGFPPYNPYAIIITPEEREDAGIRRTRELHLASTMTLYSNSTLVAYRPTDKATDKWFGKASDRSDPSKGLYYVSNDNYPFALDIPIHGFRFLRNIPGTAWEEGKNIDQFFPLYGNWAKSHGATAQAWYLHRTE